MWTMSKSLQKLHEEWVVLLKLYGMRAGTMLSAGQTIKTIFLIMTQQFIASHEAVAYFVPGTIHSSLTSSQCDAIDNVCCVSLTWRPDTIYEGP